MDERERIQRFLDGSPHAVVGASRDRSKYGNMVLRTYLQKQRPVFAVNPHAAKVEGLPSYARLDQLPETVHGISVITPPEVTESIIEQAAELGIQHVWLQPGSESPGVLAAARQHDMNVISGGACLLVVLGFRDTAD